MAVIQDDDVVAVNGRGSNSGLNTVIVVLVLVVLAVILGLWWNGQRGANTIVVPTDINLPANNAPSNNTTPTNNTTSGTTTGTQGSIQGNFQTGTTTR